jgi:hypothetical protein
MNGDTPIKSGYLSGIFRISSMQRAAAADSAAEFLERPPSTDSGLPEIKRMGGRGMLRDGLSLTLKAAPTYLPWVLRGRSLAGPLMRELDMPVSMRGLLALSVWSAYAGVGFREFRMGGGYETTHFFKEYVHLVDDQLDSREPLPADMIKSDPLNRLSVHYISEALKKDVPDRGARKAVAGIFQRSRRQAMAAVAAEQAAGPMAGSAETVSAREGTTYNTMKAIVEAWDAIHSVPRGKAERIEESLASMAMVIQLKDDIVDLGEDWGKRQNLVAGFIQRYSPEKAALQERLRAGGAPTPEWLNKSCPRTMVDVNNLYRRYKSRINPEGEAGLREAERMAEYVYLHLENVGDADRIGIWRKVAGR